jgi:N-methylhydantoinase B
MYSPGTVGSLSFVPNEVLELHYPVLVREHQVRPDSMGAGRTRGGPGLTFHVALRGTSQVDNYGYGDGMFNPPFGVFGGSPGDGGALFRVNADGTRTFFSMISYFRVREGESWVALSTGGGGYGDPFERDPEAVRRDVRDGLVSTGAAASAYGVAIDADLRVDADATAALRLASRPPAPAVAVPVAPRAGAFHRSLMQPGDTFELDPHPPRDADFTL